MTHREAKDGGRRNGRQRQAPGRTDAAVEGTMYLARVPEEGPVEHIRNALQIVSGLTYMLDTMLEDREGETLDAPALVRESTAGLQHRLSTALSQLLGEHGSHARVPASLSGA